MASTVELAAKALREQRFQEAAELFEAIRREQPGNFKIAFLMAQAYQGLGRPAQARAAFEFASHADDDRLADLARRSLEVLDRLYPNAATDPLPPAAPFPPLAKTPSSFPPTPHLPDPPPSFPSVSRLPDPPSASPSFSPASHLPDPPSAPDPAPPVAPSAPFAPAGPATCLHCGRALSSPQAACACSTEPPRLFLGALRAYARVQRVTVEIRLRHDELVVGHEVRLKQSNPPMQAVDPRLLMPLSRGYPYLTPQDLVPWHGDQTFRLKAVEPGDLSEQELSWDEMRRTLAEAGLAPQRPGMPGLGGLLREFGSLPEATLTQLENEAGPGALGRALIAGGYLGLRELVALALGPRLHTPRDRQANQIGFALLEAGALAPDQLQASLIEQLSHPVPLADLLASRVEAGVLAQARARLEPPLEEAAMAHWLILHAGLSLGELAQLRREQTRTRRTLAEALRVRGSVDEAKRQEALARFQLRARLRAEGSLRLGAILVEQRATSPERLGEALVRQISDPRPVGELLYEMGAISPEQLINALDAQEARLDRLVDHHLERGTDPVAAPVEVTAAPPDDEPDDAPAAKPRRIKARRRRKSRAPLWIAALLLGVGLTGAGGWLAWRYLVDPVAPVAGQFQPPVLSWLQPPADRLPLFLGTAPDNSASADYESIVAGLKRRQAHPLGNNLSWTPEEPLPAGLSEMAVHLAGQPEVAGTLCETWPCIAPEASGSLQLAACEQLLVLGRAAEAERRLQVDLAQGADDPDAMLLLGRSQFLQARRNEAEATLLKASLVAKSKGRVLETLGDVRASLGNLEGAAEAYLQASRLDSRRVAPWLKRGRTLLRLKQRDAARQSFDAALDIDPREPYALLNLGLIERDAGQLFAARRHLSQAQTSATSRLTSLLRAGGNSDETADAGRITRDQQALWLNTMLARALQAQGHLSAVRGHDADAKDYFSAARVVFRSDALLLEEMAEHYYRAGQYTRAASCWLLADRVAGRDPLPSLRLGQLAQSRLRLAEARMYLQRASKYAPNSPLAQQAATALAELGPRK